MKYQWFKEVVDQQIERSRNVLIAKGKEYDSNENDRLNSFKVAAALEGKTQIEALAGMMVKHTVSVFDMCKNPGLYGPNEWNEKITDHINYLLILRAMVEEEQEAIENEKYRD